MRTITHFRNAAAIALLVMGMQASAQTINAYRYWFDDNGANAVTTTVTGGQQYTLSTVDASTLPKGYHRITLLFRDSNNDWGVPVTSMFYRNGGILTAYQYWFDDDVSTLVETTVGSTDLLSVVAQIDASALSNGAHTITLRTKDQQNGFSVPITHSFNVAVGIEEIPGLDRVLLFPNPSNGDVYLRFDAHASTDLTISVIDVTGRAVLSEERQTVNGVTLRTLDTASLPAGTYHVRLIGAKGMKDLPMVMN